MTFGTTTRNEPGRPRRREPTNEGWRRRANNPARRGSHDRCDPSRRRAAVRESQRDRPGTRCDRTTSRPDSERGQADGAVPRFEGCRRNQRPALNRSRAPLFERARSLETDTDVIQMTPMRAAARCSCSSLLRMIKSSFFARPSNASNEPRPPTRVSGSRASAPFEVSHRVPWSHVLGERRPDHRPPLSGGRWDKE